MVENYRESACAAVKTQSHLQKNFERLARQFSEELSLVGSSVALISFAVAQDNFLEQGAPLLTVPAACGMFFLGKMNDTRRKAWSVFSEMRALKAEQSVTRHFCDNHKNERLPDIPSPTVERTNCVDTLDETESAAPPDQSCSPCWESGTLQQLAEREQVAAVDYYSSLLRRRISE